MSAEAAKLRDIVRSKDPMHELCQNRLITNEACDWVKCALDPFHDMQLDHLRGYPDVSTEPTVVVKIQTAHTVAAPAGLPAGQNWDCHIVTSPVDFNPASAIRQARTLPFGDPPSSTGTGTTMADGAGAVNVTSLQTGRMDGLLINSVPSDSDNGANLTYTPGHCPAVAGGGYHLQNLNLDDYLEFEQSDLGVYRIIYSGFEVVNTTAQIYKQGAVTVYEYGNSYEVGASYPVKEYDTVSQTDGFCSGPRERPTTYFRSPPNTIAEAKIMPGAHTWAAQDGCYNTAKFQTDNPFQGATKRPFIIAQNNVIGAPNSGFGDVDGVLSAGSFASDFSLGVNLVGTSATPPDLKTVGGPVHFSRMNTTGAYLTGLSHETTLFVTWRVGIERLPSANKPTFLALAQPAAAYDPNALVLYNMVAHILPPGCPQGYNDAGKWFRWIQDAARKSIPTVYPIIRTASALATQMGRPVIGGALKQLGETIRPMAEKQSAERLQAAVRRKQGRSGGRGRAAVGNWQQPTPFGVRSGGTNGLR